MTIDLETEADTNSDLHIFDSTRLKEGGPSLHFHYTQDEWWYVISREYLVKLEKKFTMRKQVGKLHWILHLLSGLPHSGLTGYRLPHTFCAFRSGFARSGSREMWR